jgi:serine/threonine-protein kinase
VADLLTHLQSALSDRYTLERELGRGGMATVYLARDLRHRRRVALKVLHPELAYALGADRFLREIEVAANLSHPHLLPLFDSGEVEGLLYYVMPYVEGETLRDRVSRETQLPVEDALEIAQQVAAALAYAHGQGVIHRDIKPENILLSGGNAFVADFGIAHALGRAGAERLTETGMAVGTVAYMSPEQASGARQLDGRSDVYSLGCVLYEMLAGEPPYTGPTAHAIMAKRLSDPVPSVRRVRQAITPGINQVVARALAPTPADRFATAAQFAEALTRGETAPAAVARPRLRRWLAAAVLVLLAGAGWLGMRRSESGPGTAAAAPIDQKYVVAVLPFEYLSSDTSRRYFATGITEEITGQLSRLSALRVLGRSSLTSYAGAPDRVPRLVRDLGVGSVVEGTVRIEGDRARVGAQLVDGRSGQAIWTEQYDRQLADVFGVQTDIARRITTALQASLTPAESRRAGRPPTVDLAAYELYLRAWDLDRFNVTENLESIRILRRAVARDTTFAAAYAELARRYLFLGSSRGSAHFESGLAAARKAIAADPELAEAHFAMGGAQGARGRLAAARSAYRRALELDPNAAGAMMDLSNLEDYLGAYDESLYWAALAVPLEPGRSVAYYHLSLPLVRLGDDAATERLLVGATRRFPSSVRLECMFSMLELRRGRDAAALERARSMVARNPENQEAQACLAELAVMARAPDAEALVKPLAEAGPDTRPQFLPESFGTLYGWTLAARGERARADSLWDAALARDRKSLADSNETFDGPAEIAAIGAARGELSSAMEWLEQAYARGFKDPQVLRRDPFFDGARTDPRYQRVAAAMQEHVATMRRHAMATHDTLFTPPAR